MSVPMFTLRRTKGLRSIYIRSIDAAGNITGFAGPGEGTPDRLALAVDEATAKQVCARHAERFKAGGVKAGRLDVFDASGKIVSWGTVGEAGEEPVAPKPVASLPDVAARVELLEERVGMIEATDTPHLVQFTADEIKAIKELLASKPATPPASQPPQAGKSPTASPGGGSGGKQASAPASAPTPAPAA